MDRREFIWRGVSMALTAGMPVGMDLLAATKGGYSVAILGDTHFDAEPESVYHSHYDESNRHAKIQHAEFRRNGEMWRKRCRDLLSASAKLAEEKPTDFVLQLGDIIQGDCDDVATHQKMLDDCIKMLRSPYPKGLPFLTVLGNHDVRGKGAREAYLQFAKAFIEREVGTPATYPAFSFHRNDDLWVFCDFETWEIDAIIAQIESDPKARHTFLVSHGPFTPWTGYGWRLAGNKSLGKARARLYEVLSRRNAVVLSGHTHTVDWFRHQNKFGGFSEFTSNSVWSKDELAKAEPKCTEAALYGKLFRDGCDKKRLDEFAGDLALFQSGMTGCYHSETAGHFRLNVEEKRVEMEFYRGADMMPTKVFAMKG